MSVRTFCKFGIAVGLANYGLYALLSYLAGGDALHGHVIAGHYLIQTAGGLVEVSRTLFLFSRWEAYSLLATFPLGLACACVLSPAERRDEGALGMGPDESWTAATPRNGR